MPTSAFPDDCHATLSAHSPFSTTCTIATNNKKLAHIYRHSRIVKVLGRLRAFLLPSSSTLTLQLLRHQHGLSQQVKGGVFESDSQEIF